MFINRSQAGRRLAEKLIADKDRLGNREIIVLGVPRGGLAVAREVADLFNCPLDVIISLKITAPESSKELAIGAVGETQGSNYINEKLAAELKISDQYLNQEIAKQKQEIKIREKVYRQGRPVLDLFDRIVFIVDDGAATGATLIAAAREVWEAKPKRVIIAIPVAPGETVRLLENEADEVAVLEEPVTFFSVGQFYEDFSQVSDTDAIKLLQRHSGPACRQAGS